jgi:hypothetical protein
MPAMRNPVRPAVCDNQAGECQNKVAFSMHMVLEDAAARQWGLA